MTASHAVAYAAKSTEDRHGSIPTQIEDCRVLAERQGWEVVDAFADEAFSAFSGNRGPGLEQAKALAAKTAAEHGRCVLVAQDADRFARGAGDAPGAADHLGEVYFVMKRQGVELWTCRSGQLDLLRAAIEGERSHDESARKTQAVRAGLKRRKDRGAPVGPLPLGYTVKNTIVADKVLTMRVVDAATVNMIERAFDLIERGSGYGDVARAFNAEGLTGRRGRPFNNRAVRDIIFNEAYAGRKGYPQIIEPARFDLIHKGLKRPDPAASQKRQGGRKPTDDSYFLRGVAFCMSCNASMYTLRRAAGRMYICRNRCEATGLCSAPLIPAGVLERQVLEHLHWFVGSVEDWITEKTSEVDVDRQAREAAVERDRLQLAELDRQRERHLTEYDKLVDEGSSLARIALERVETLDQDREARQHALDATEAVVAEWADPPDVDEALDYYTALSELVDGHVKQAKGAADLNRALHQVLAGLWAGLDGDTLHAQFQLRITDEPDTPNNGLRQVLMRSLGEKRMTLPAATDVDHIELTKQGLAEPCDSPWSGVR